MTFNPAKKIDLSADAPLLLVFMIFDFLIQDIEDENKKNVGTEVVVGLHDGGKFLHHVFAHGHDVGSNIVLRINAAKSSDLIHDLNEFLLQDSFHLRIDFFIFQIFEISKQQIDNCACELLWLIVLTF